MLLGSPATEIDGDALLWNVLSPTCICPFTSSVASRPLVTAPVDGLFSSTRALSKYCTRRIPPGASAYGSCCPSWAVASGP